MLSSPTKNDLFEYLARLGLRRGYAVIGEFHFPLSQRTRPKDIDLVWARRRPLRPGERPRSTLHEWVIHAAFEIEGCNVPRDPEFRRHENDFPLMLNAHAEPMAKYVVLYTAAYDRAWDHDQSRDEEVRCRQQWALGQEFRVLDGRRIVREARLFPQPVRQLPPGG